MQKVIVIDVGSGKPGMKLKGTMLEVANSGTYVAIDREVIFGPAVVADAYSLPFRDECANAVICRALLEHLTKPQIAIGEIYRVLKRGGTCYVIVPFLAGYHGNEYYSDYYRFTRDGLGYLFRHFPKQRIEPLGGALEVLMTIVLFKRMPQLVIKYLMRIIRSIDNLFPCNITRHWYGEFQKGFSYD